MKFILTGCTGFIGSEVLRQCLRNPSITSIVALSRRKFPDSVGNDSKLKVIIMEDFTSYSPEVLNQLSSADAYIWCMGTTAGIKALEVDYLLAFGNAFSRTLLESGKKFRYLHLSGAAVERDQDKALWFKSEMRKMKGQAEENMLGFAQKEEAKGLWETLIVKAGFVISSRNLTPRDFTGWLLGSKISIRVNELAAFMIDSAMSGWKDGENTVADNKAMAMKGREFLAEYS